MSSINAIDREWNNGFDIWWDIEYGDGKWSAIMAKGTGYKQQVYLHKRYLKNLR